MQGDYTSKKVNFVARYYVSANPCLTFKKQENKMGTSLPKIKVKTWSEVRKSKQSGKKRVVNKAKLVVEKRKK